MIDLYNFNIISKAVHHKYLYEVAAIPKDTREKYLKKLEKRLNSYGQKNVKLIKLIYWHIEEDHKLKWNEKKICSMLKISKNMLYVYKSKILRDLRKLHFNWNEIEKNEFENKTGKDEYTLKFLKAEKMFNLGMKRESKTFFLRLEKQITDNKKIAIEHKVILLRIYSYLFLHNIVSNSLPYSSKLENLINSLVRTKYIIKRPDLKSEILIIKYNTLAYKSISNLKTNQACLEAVKFFELSLKEAKSIRDKSLKNNITANISIWLADVYLDLGDYQNAKKIIQNGIESCQKYNLNEELVMLKTLILWVKLRTGEDINTINIVDKIEIYYKNAGYFKNNATLRCKFLNRCASIASMRADINKISYFFYEYISAAIISNGVNSILRALYFIKFILYFNKIKSFTLKKNNKQKKYFTVTHINERYQKRLCNTIDELLTNFNKINSIYFRYDFYCFMLETEFWKGLNSDFDKAKYILKQIHWINSTRGKLLNHNPLVIEVLSTGISMMEDFKYMNKERFLNKYEQSYKALSLELLNNSTEDALSTYLIFSFITEKIGYSELMHIAEELYFKLQNKFPDNFTAFMKKLEEEKSNSSESTLNNLSSNAA